MATLYELSENARELYELLQADEIDEETFHDTLEGLGAEEKLASYCQVIGQLKADAAMFAEEEARLAARKKAAERSVDRMKQAVLLYLDATKQDSAKAGTYKVRRSFSEAVEVLDEDAIPSDYFEAVSPRLSKSKIKAAIKSGVEVAGAVIVKRQGVVIQ